MSRRYTKNDVDFHSDRGPLRPAVNVKIRNLYQLDRIDPDVDQPEFEPPFTYEWVEEHISEDQLNWVFNHVCEMAWEMLQQDAEDLFGKHVKVYSEGRQGGWAVIDGIDDFDSWDAIYLAKWAKFAKWARAEADDIPRAMLESIYINDFQHWLADQAEEAGLHREVQP